MRIPLARTTALAGTVAGAAMAFLAVSCAPTLRRPSAPDVSTISSRYERQRGPRASRLAAARIEATLWVEGDRLGRWPALQVDVALVGPDAMRARVASLIGTALDLAVRGDSLRAYFPPRRLGMEVGALEESLGVRAPGAWACRALAASWDAREAHWVLPEGDSLWRAVWREGADSLAMSVSADGLPASVELHDAAGRAHRLRYLRWESVDRVPWPQRVKFEEADGTVRIVCRVDHVQFLAQPDPRWLALRLPASVERVDWSRVRRVLARLGEAE